MGNFLGNVTQVGGTFTGNGSGLTNLNASNVSSGTLAIARGGTGQTTANAALNALLPAQSANAYLKSDGTNTSWVIPVPAGMVLPWAGLGLPSGWLLCDGSSVSRTTYATLFAALCGGGGVSASTTNGSTTVSGMGDTSWLKLGWYVQGTGIPANATIATIVNGSTITISANATATGSPTVYFTPWGATATNFTLPDMLGRTPIGSGSGTSLTTRKLGDIGGTETHTLTTPEIPAHTHTFTDQTFGGYGQGTPILGQAVATNFSATTSSTGGGGSHNNMQPWTCLTFLIKT